MNMKRLSLQPLGDSCMKGLCKSWFFIGLLMTFCLVACSDDDDEQVNPAFPAKQNIICNANDTREFTFEANTNWSLESSAIWCKFKSNDTEEYVQSGVAGTQTVTLLVTDDDITVGKISVAKLELTMGGQTIVIGEVTRSEVDYKLKIYDTEGNDITETGVLKVGYGSFARFDVKANFRFAATNLPGWVELEGGSLVGAVNQKVQGGLKIIENDIREKYPVVASDENVITFSDEEGRSFKTFKVEYDGMTPGEMKLTLPASYPTNWVVSMDGKTFTQKSTGGSTGEISLQKRMQFTIKTLNDDYEIVFFNKGWDDKLHLVGSSYDFFYYKWMHCEKDEKDGGKLSITVDEYIPQSWNGDPDERTGYILAFSRAEYESIKDNLEETIIVDGEIAYRYEQRNLLIGFTQKEVKAEEDNEAFKVTYFNSSWQLEEAKIIKAESDYEYGIEEVYTMKQPDSNGQVLTVNPLMDGNFEMDWTVQVWSGDNDVTTDYLEPMDKEFYISNNKALTEDLHICIKQNYMNVKVLIITPN